MMPKTIPLEEGERVIAVVPAPACGPGWANEPTWVYIVSRDGRLRQACIQPWDRSEGLHALYGVGAAMCDALLLAVPTGIHEDAFTQ